MDKFIDSLPDDVKLLKRNFGRRVFEFSTGLKLYCCSTQSHNWHKESQTMRGCPNNSTYIDHSVIEAEHGHILRQYHKWDK